MADPSAALPSMNYILGPMLIGTVLNIFLYGFMVMQTHLYFIANQRDPKWLKVLVLWLLFVDTLNSGFTVAFLYDYTIVNFGNYEAIATATWMVNSDPFVTTIISCTVQCFFAWRVNRLTGLRWFSYFIAFLGFCQLLCGLGTSIASTIVIQFVEFQKFKAIVITWLTMAVATDILITGSLVWFLRSHRTGFSSTDDVISRITRLTLQTGALTSICVLMNLIIYLRYANALHFIFNLPLCKLYTNSMLSSLNARTGWKFGDHSGPSNESRGSTRKQAVPAHGVRIQTVETVHRDDYELDLATIKTANPHMTDSVDTKNSNRFSMASVEESEIYENKSPGLTPPSQAGEFAVNRKGQPGWNPV